MKKSIQLIACILAVVIAFPMVHFTFAAPAGGITDVDLQGLGVDVYLSHDNALKLLDKLTPSITLKTFYDIVKGMVEGGSGWFKSILWIAAGKILPSTVADIEAGVRNGRGIIIYLPFFSGMPQVRSQSELVPAVIKERVQISITCSPSEGGKTAGGGSFLKYVSTAKDRLTRIQLNAYPNSGWQFDGWYEGNALVHSDVIYSFPAESNRNLEARFKRGGSGGGSGSTPSPTQLTVASSNDAEYIITIPANTTVYGFSSPTSTSRLTLYAPRSAEYTLYCTKYLSMSDGTIRYFFRSGGASARDYYLMFTNAMTARIVYTPGIEFEPEDGEEDTTPEPTPEVGTPSPIEWDTSSVIASATLQAGKTYDIENIGSSAIQINNDSSTSKRFDWIWYSWDYETQSHYIAAVWENTYSYSPTLNIKHKYHITIKDYDIKCFIPYEQSSFLNGIP